MNYLLLQAVQDTFCPHILYLSRILLMLKDNYAFFLTSVVFLNVVFYVDVRVCNINSCGCNVFMSECEFLCRITCV